MWWRRSRPLPAVVPPVQAAPLTAARAQALLRRIDWIVLRRLDGLLQGDHRSSSRGSGLDLADLREYQPSDDVRHIDWNVTARLGQAHVRVYNEDRDMVAWLLIDRSPSQTFGSGGQSKHELMRDVALTLARWMGRHGNRVGVVLYESETQVPRVLPPRAGREQLLRLLHELDRPAAPPCGQPTQLGSLLRHAAAVVRGRCTVALLSDFISEPGWGAPLGKLAQRHDVLAVRLVDPLEQEWPDLGWITLRDPETGDTLQVDTHDPRFRARFAALAREREQQLHSQLAQAGADALDLVTDGDWPQALMRFAQLRKARWHTGAAVHSRASPQPGAGT